MTKENEQAVPPRILTPKTPDLDTFIFKMQYFTGPPIETAIRKRPLFFKNDGLEKAWGGMKEEMEELRAELKNLKPDCPISVIKTMLEVGDFFVYAHTFTRHAGENTWTLAGKEPQIEEMLNFAHLACLRTGLSPEGAVRATLFKLDLKYNPHTLGKMSSRGMSYDQIVELHRKQYVEKGGDYWTIKLLTRKDSLQVSDWKL